MAPVPVLAVVQQVAVLVANGTGISGGTAGGGTGDVAPGAPTEPKV